MDRAVRAVRATRKTATRRSRAIAAPRARVSSRTARPAFISTPPPSDVSPAQPGTSKSLWLVAFSSETRSRNRSTHTASPRSAPVSNNRERSLREIRSIAVDLAAVDDLAKSLACRCSRFVANCERRGPNRTFLTEGRQQMGIELEILVATVRNEDVEYSYSFFICSH